ncbi:hypothetical protein QF027_009428 [Streptomyces canus]|nr:hypothetical protein [Streptomyces canus]
MVLPVQVKPGWSRPGRSCSGCGRDVRRSVRGVPPTHRMGPARAAGPACGLVTGAARCPARRCTGRGRPRRWGRSRTAAPGGGLGDVSAATAPAARATTEGTAQGLPRLEGGPALAGGAPLLSGPGPGSVRGWPPDTLQLRVLLLQSNQRLGVRLFQQEAWRPVLNGDDVERGAAVRPGCQEGRRRHIGERPALQGYRPAVEGSYPELRTTARLPPCSSTRPCLRAAGTCRTRSRSGWHQTRPMPLDSAGAQVSAAQRHAWGVRFARSQGQIRRKPQVRGLTWGGPSSHLRGFKPETPQDEG